MLRRFIADRGRSHVLPNVSAVFVLSTYPAMSHRLRSSKIEAPPKPFRVLGYDLVGPKLHKDGHWNQNPRMPKFDEEVQIYPSPGREKLWSALDEELEALNGNPTARRIGVTGIKGCGKSHALLWWAKQQMDRGHLVLYVQNAECFELGWWGRVLHSVLEHAATTLWKHWGLNRAALQDVFPKTCHAPDDLEQIWARLNEKILSLVRPRSEAVDYLINDLGTMLDVAPRSVPALFAEFIHLLVKRIVAVADCPPGSFIHSIFIVDQDNRLQKAMSFNNTLALRANRFISQSPCSLTVICASGNNQRWDNDAALRTIQVSPEPVPLQWIGLPHLLPLEVLTKIAKLNPDSVKSIADVKTLVPKLFMKLEKLTKFYPLELRLFSDFCARVRAKHIEWESVLGEFEAMRMQQIRSDIWDFISDRPDRRRVMWEFVKGLRFELDPEMDRQYITALTEDGKPDFVTPTAFQAAWEVLQWSYAELPLPPEGHPDREAVYKSKVFVSLLLSEDFPQRGVRKK